MLLSDRHDAKASTSKYSFSTLFVKKNKLFTREKNHYQIRKYKAISLKTVITSGLTKIFSLWYSIFTSVLFSCLSMKVFFT